MTPPPRGDFAQYPSLANRPVVITGGATGIGASLVAHFAAQKARVGFLDLDSTAGEALAAALARTSSYPPMFVRCDLRDIAALRAAIAAIRTRLGAVRVLINNAADDNRHAFDDVTPTAWDAGIAVNLRHAFFAAQAVKDDMRASGGGSIINLGSISWMTKEGGMPVYTTAKSAMQGLTRSLAQNLGRHRIRVNTLVPGWVMTEKQLRLWVNDQSSRKIDENQCLPDRLEPADVARMALFLAADDSASCTAQDFIVDGGWS